MTLGGCLRVEHRTRRQGPSRPASSLPLTTLLVLWALSRPLSADNLFAIEIGDIEGRDWEARAVALELTRDGDGEVRFRARADRIEIKGEPPLQDLELECRAGRQLEIGIECSEGWAGFQHAELGPQRIDWQGRFVSTADWRLDFSGLRLASGRISGGVEGGADAWRAKVRGRELRLERVPRLELPKGWTLSGRAGLALDVSGVGAQPQQLRVDLDGAGIRYADASGLQVGEGLGLDLRLNARPQRGGWQFDVTTRLKTGQLYTDPVFLEVKADPLLVRATGSLSDGADRLILGEGSLGLGDVLQLRGEADLSLSPFALRSARARIGIGQWAQAFPVFIQPFLIGTVGGDLQLRGSADIDLSLDADGPATVDVRLGETRIEDSRGRFGLDRLSGDLHWRRTGEAESSRLEFGAGHLYKIPFGAFTTQARLQGGQLELLSPVQVPVLGGRFDLQAFQLSGLLDRSIEWRTSARLRDLSLDQLTRDLGWPPFSGVLNASLPNLRFEQRLTRADGELVFDVFGGRVRLGGLRIRDLLGVAPVLEGSMQVRGLDLRELTQTFSFGRIEGRLDGEVEDVQLIAWQPNRFRLRLYTPENDDSRRRISQKAVENLTELGSGVPAGLSRGFLGLFKEFSYGQIDIQIELDGNNARLNGIARPEGGYYLVRGSGLPRIDVVGRNQRVAWKELVDRLKNIQLEGARVVPQ